MKYKFAVWGWLILIFILSMMPGSAIPKVGWRMYIPVDKIAHFLLYAILAGLWYKSLMESSKERKRGLVLGIILLCSGYGAMMEVFQYYFLWGRSFEIPDIFANIIGSIAGTLIVCLFLKKQNYGYFR